MYNGPTAVTSISNSVLWDNTSVLYNETGSQVTVAHSIIKDGYPGTGNLNLYPQFAAPGIPAGADSVFGTADDGLALTGCSPAINAGNNDSIPAGVVTDITGSPAIYNTIVDMGAYEYQQLPYGDTLLYVDSAISVSGTGTSWATAFKTLQEALTTANNCSAVKQIWVKKGTYFPTALPANSSLGNSNRDFTFALKNNLAIYGGFPASGTPMFADRDAATHPTVLSGDFNGDDVVTGSGASLSITGANENAIHVTLSINNDSTAILDGFTIQGGNASGGSSLIVSGEVPDSRNGGGLYNYHSSARILRCTFSGNAASFQGGGIYNGESAPTLQYCTFSRNRISITGASRMGGGLCNFSSPFNSSSLSAKISNCVFIGNSSPVFGGGIGNYHVSPVISNCTFSNNSGGSGGGVSVDQGGQAAIINCLFTGNIATQSGGAAGGGIFIANQSTLTNCTFAGNIVQGASGLGGGVYTQFSTSISNCIVWGNTAATGPSIYGVVGTTPSVSYSLVQGGYTGTGNVSGDPLFADTSSPAGNDGRFGTPDDGLYVHAASPALNTGNNSLVPAGTTTDIAGNARIAGNVDMGAYEGSTVLPVRLLDFNVTLGDNDVIVRWTTAMEANSDYFEIQYATDGIHFSKAGQTAAAGQSNGLLSYSFIHRNAAALPTSILYYRLKQMDKDGVFTYSKIVALSLPEVSEKILYYPNPVARGTLLLFKGKGIEQVSLFNIFGECVSDSHYTERQPVQISTGQLTAGTYLIKINNVQTGKLTVKEAD